MLGLGAGSAADFLSYADLLFMAKQPDEARKAIETARKLGTEDPRAFYIEARCARFAGDHETERRLLQSAIERHPSYGDAWQQLIDSTSDTELPVLIDKCEQLADEESTSSRDSIILLYAAGRARERLGDYGLACEQFVKANGRQLTDARARNKTYDKRRNERFIAQVREQFDGQGVCASQTHVADQPVFIVGMPRSGTTLVESILGGLDGITIGGESEALEFVATRYYNAFGLGQAKPVRELLAQDWDELAERYWRLQTAKKCRLTDKMPTNFRHVGLICRMFPNAPIVYVRRDPRDVALSIYSRRFTDGHAYATDFVNLAHYYWLSQQWMSHWQRLHADRIIDIEYERLVADPEAQTRSIAEFCGLTWQPECLEFHQRRDASYTFSELQVREPLNAKGIGRWRNYSKALVPFIDACVANGVQLRDN
jgi:tetratricopeptide (TPR) repeat protein